MPHETIFYKAATNVCHDAGATHCIINAFVVFPATMLFLLTIPFTFHLCEVRQHGCRLPLCTVPTLTAGLCVLFR